MTSFYRMKNFICFIRPCKSLTLNIFYDTTSCVAVFFSEPGNIDMTDLACFDHKFSVWETQAISFNNMLFQQNENTSLYQGIHWCLPVSKSSLFKTSKS